MVLRTSKYGWDFCQNWMDFYQDGWDDFYHMIIIRINIKTVGIYLKSGVIFTANLKKMQLSGEFSSIFDVSAVCSPFLKYSRR